MHGNFHYLRIDHIEINSGAGAGKLIKSVHTKLKILGRVADSMETLGA
jgi:hypothetical protein